MTSLLSAYVVSLFAMHVALFTRCTWLCLRHVAHFRTCAEGPLPETTQTAQGDKEWSNTPLLSSHLLADQRSEHTKNHGGQHREYLVIISI